MPVSGRFLFDYPISISMALPCEPTTQSVEKSLSCQAVPDPGAGRWLGSSKFLVWLLLFAVALRLPGIHRPLVGNFATKNAVYGMIARNWARGEAGFWQPTLDVLRGEHRAWHLVEVPISAYMSGSLWRWLGGSLDVWGRATAIAWSVLAVALVYRLACFWHGSRVAAMSSLIMAAAPVSVIYGQSFMLEPSVVALSLGAMLGVVRWCATSRWQPALVALVSMTLLLLTKLYMLVFALPLLAVAAEQSGVGPQLRGRVAIRRMGLVLVGIGISAVPALGWYGWVMNVSATGHSEAARMFYSLRDSLQAHGWPHPLLREPAFYVGLLRDLGTVVLTPVGLALALFGVRDRRWRRHGAWLLAGGVLIVALPRKFHEMNYYFLVILPPLAMLAGLGWNRLLSGEMMPRRWAAATVMAFLLLAVRYAWRPAFETPREDRAVVVAAARMRHHSERGEPIVTTHGSTIDLLYYCDRPGWALAPEDPSLTERLVRCRQQGARRWVVANIARAEGSRQCRFWMRRLPLLVEGDDYRIYDLEHDDLKQLDEALAYGADAPECGPSRRVAADGISAGTSVRR